MQNSENTSGKGVPTVSFEFFPPKTEELEEKLWNTVTELESLQPDFVSVTYGAGGSTREKTHKIISKIKQETNLSPAAHLTCVKATKEEINEVAKSYLDIGVNHIVALRGDPPDMTGEYVSHPGGYQYAADLVAGLQEVGEFEISVAAYPEVHPAAKSAADDLRYLKEKMDAGATRAITQYFFDNDGYFKFMEEAKNIGIDKPIVPGLLPISNFKQAVSFSERCGANVPAWLHEEFAGVEGEEDTEKLSIELLVKQSKELIEFGCEHIHFYTLNRPKIVKAVCAELGIK